MEGHRFFAGFGLGRFSERRVLNFMKSRLCFKGFKRSEQEVCVAWYQVQLQFIFIPNVDLVFFFSRRAAQYPASKRAGAKASEKAKRTTIPPEKNEPPN